MKLQVDLAEFIKLLNFHDVSYLIVGAHALAFHGHPRYTGDIDVFIERSALNAKKLVEVISEFGFDSVGLHPDDFLEEEQVIQLGVAPNRIDLLTTLTAVTFDEAKLTAVAGTLDTIPVKFLSRDLLIKNKEALGRAQDLADVEVLKRRNGLS